MGGRVLPEPQLQRRQPGTIAHQRQRFIRPFGQSDHVAAFQVPDRLVRQHARLQLPAILATGAGAKEIAGLHAAQQFHGEFRLLRDECADIVLLHFAQDVQGLLETKVRFLPREVPRFKRLKIVIV